MPAPDLTLYGQTSWMCPWGFHAVVALEEKQLPYKVELVALPLPPELQARFQSKGLLANVPMLVHGDLWITESLAISEYLAERFPFPAHPRLFPADLAERARARQVMSWLRTSLRTLRAERPIDNVFGRVPIQPFTPKGQADADELVRVADQLIKPGHKQLFAEWSIADLDLATALMRMIASSDPVPQHLLEFAMAHWERRSVKRYLANVLTTP